MDSNIWHRVEAIASVVAIVVALLGVGWQISAQNARQRVLSALEYCEKFSTEPKIEKFTKYTSDAGKRFKYAYPELFSTGKKIKEIRELKETILSKNNDNGSLKFPVHEGSRSDELELRKFHFVNNYFVHGILGAQNGAFDTKTIASCVGRQMICFREKYSIRLPIYDETDPDMLKLKSFINSSELDVENECAMATMSEWS